MRRLVGICALVAATALQGCDSGPKGPGPLTVVVESQGAEVGALVVRVTGPGVTGFEEVGSTRLFSATTAVPNERRVVLVGSGQGAIRFSILVTDRGDAVPVVSVVQAVNVSNLAMATAGITVRVER